MAMDSTRRHRKKKGKQRGEEVSPCNSPLCFFCSMKESDPSLRRTRVAKCFKEMPIRDQEEHVLVLSGLWNVAMSHPDDPEFPSLGIFECMANLIHRGVNDKGWIARHQNVYIPYYAAHIIGSYTINKPEFAERAVQSGVIPPLMELLRGKMSWVEQRVAVRALGHLASYDQTIISMREYEEEIVQLCMDLAISCLDVVYKKFVGLKDGKKKLKYQCDLLTRGLGGVEMENRKAEEWASQLQCWSLYTLNCFACKERALNLICREGFLKVLCKMWGGLVNDCSPAGVGLLRILCYSKDGRRKIADCEETLKSLCHLSRSSDDWQYMGIDCLLLLFQDPDTRLKVMDVAAAFLVDLVELGDLGVRKNVGDAITKALLLDYSGKKLKHKVSKEVEKVLEVVWDIKVERRRKEKKMSERDLQEKKSLVGVKKQKGNESFWYGDVEEAVVNYSEALEMCPLKLIKERIVLHSNRAQCYLILKDAMAAISDTTRALSLSRPVNSHKRSLWRRSQAYDMMGLAKESLMDCIMFVNGRYVAKGGKHIKIPYYAARMINKQMNATWVFAAAHFKKSGKERHEDHLQEENIEDHEEKNPSLKKKERLNGSTKVSMHSFQEHSWDRGKRRVETPSRRKKAHL